LEKLAVNMKIVIIGGGNMGKTYAQSFLGSHIIRPYDLVTLEKNADKHEELRRNNIINIETMPGEFIRETDLIVLAVKPQDALNLYPSMKPFVREDHMVLSIMAGVKIDAIEEGLGIKKIIRAMPNLPAQIGMGMTAFTANEEVTKNELIEVQNLLSTTGKAIYFSNENMIDASTAISGSGPAYVYYFMDAMIKAAKEMGFSDSQADLLVWQTFNGSIHLLNKNTLSCDEWIARVKSKGGTTEAALDTFKDRNLDVAIKSGLKAALQRAEDLGS